MSTRFNKQTASDFGLIELEGTDTAINPIDNSLWKKYALYDYGWGRENGYYRTPILDYDSLMELILSSNQDDDVYGAAAIILDKFPNELLDTCEQVSHALNKTKEFKKLVSVFHLDLGVNQSPILGKTFEEIKRDSSRWRAISDVAKSKKSRWPALNWFKF